MTLGEELREIAAILEMPTSLFHREGGQLRSIASRVERLEERAERAERAAEQWKHAHDYATRELEALAAAGRPPSRILRDQRPERVGVESSAAGTPSDRGNFP